MAIVGCYSMDLYCDVDCDEPDFGENCSYRTNYTGRTHSDCKRQAQADGWSFRKNGIVICPGCNPRY